MRKVERGQQQNGKSISVLEEEEASAKKIVEQDDHSRGPIVGEEQQQEYWNWFGFCDIFITMWYVCTMSTYCEDFTVEAMTLSKESSIPLGLSL